MPNPNPPSPSKPLALVLADNANHADWQNAATRFGASFDRVDDLEAGLLRLHTSSAPYAVFVTGQAAPYRADDVSPPIIPDPHVSIARAGSLGWVNCLDFTAACSDRRVYLQGHPYSRRARRDAYNPSRYDAPPPLAYYAYLSGGRHLCLDAPTRLVMPQIDCVNVHFPEDDRLQGAAIGSWNWAPLPAHVFALAREYVPFFPVTTLPAAVGPFAHAAATYLLEVVAHVRGAIVGFGGPPLPWRGADPPPPFDQLRAEAPYYEVIEDLAAFLDNADVAIGRAVSPGSDAHAIHALLIDVLRDRGLAPIADAAAEWHRRVTA